MPEGLVYVAAVVVGVLILLVALVAVVVAAVVRFYRGLDEAGDPLSKDAEDLR